MLNRKFLNSQNLKDMWEKSSVNLYDSCKRKNKLNGNNPFHLFMLVKIINIQIAMLHFGKQ